MTVNEIECIEATAKAYCDEYKIITHLNQKNITSQFNVNGIPLFEELIIIYTV